MLTTLMTIGILGILLIILWPVVQSLRCEAKELVLILPVAMLLGMLTGCASAESDKQNTPKSAEKGQTDSLNSHTESDWELINRDGHPTYYGSVEVSHSIWDDVEKGKILFADGFESWGKKSILSMDAYRKSDLIRGVYVSFSNFEPPVEVSLDEILPVVASYLPFDIMERYYQFKDSKLIAPNEGKDSSNLHYVVSYNLTDESVAAYYSGEHEYSGTLDVIIEVNQAGVVQNFNIGFGTPRWMSSLDLNGYHQEEWEFNFLDFQ